MARECVTAEVVWLAGVYDYDCEGRSIVHRTISEHDTEGDARRALVAAGLSEKDSSFWGKRWEDDRGYRSGDITRTLREVVAR